MVSALSPGRRALQDVFKPVPHVRDSDARIVNLTMMITALFLREHLECLVGTSNFRDAELGQLEANLLVPFAVYEEEWTSDFLDYAFEFKPSQFFQCVIARFDVEDPKQVLRRH